MRHLALSLLLLAAGDAAAETVYRCEDAQGRRLFADRPCQRIGALPLPSENDPPPTALDPNDPELKRWRETTRPPPPGAAIQRPAAAPDAAPADEPPAAATGCPAPTPERLREVLQASIDQGDANAIASLYHWPGANGAAAHWVFEQAERLIAAGPVEVQLRHPPADDAWLWAGEAPPARDAVELPALSVAAAGIDLRFRLVRNAGCVWLLRD